MCEHSILPLQKTLRFSEINKIENLEGRVDEIVDFIEQNPVLREVVVDQHLNVKVGKIYTAILYNKSRIRSIRILQVSLDGHLAEWISRFRRMENLVQLELNGLRKITFSEFVFNTPGETNARNVAYMLQTNTKLQELSLVGLHSDTAKLFLQALAEFSRPQASLRKLSALQCGSIHDCFLYIGQALDKFPLLDTLVIRDYPNDRDVTPPKRFAEAIERSPSLRVVDICTNHFSNRGAERILRSLCGKSQLKTVSVGSLPRNDEVCGRLLARIIDANQCIEDISIVRGNASRRAVPVYRGVDVTALGTALDSNQSLRTFTLHDFSSDTAGMHRLCDILARKESLESLTFRTDSSLDQKGIRLISKVIEYTSSLRELSLQVRKLDSPRTIDLLFQAMEGNLSIEHLQLHIPAMDDSAVIRMGEMLYRKTTLKALSLEAHKRLHDPCVQSLIEAVKRNKSITKIESYLGGLLLGESPLLRRELDYYLELNKGPRRLLRANTPVPTGLWPLALSRADTFCRRNKCSPDVLYFLVKEKCDLFSNY